MPSIPAFDSTGINPLNKIINEAHSVTAGIGQQAFLIVPEAAPFYGDSLYIVDASGNTLTEGVDYYLTHHWAQASDSVGKEIYGTITLIPNWVVGVYKVNYQTIGGDYVTAPSLAITDGLIALAAQYVNVDWSTAPTVFPPTPHTEALSQFSGMNQIYQGLDNIANALQSPARGVHVDDIQDYSQVYLNTIVEPFMSLMNSVNDNNNTMASMITNFIAALKPENQAKTIPPDLQHYSFTIFKGLTIKVGSIQFAYGNAPSHINFVDPPFGNQCLFFIPSIYFADNSIGISNDRVKNKIPTKSGVDVAVTYDTTNLINNRLITYFAIGF